MTTDRQLALSNRAFSSARLAAQSITALAAAVAAMACHLAGAQVLTSPIAAPSTPSGASSNQAKPASPELVLPAGQGAGVHGANSPFAQLAARDDVVPWSVLTAVKTKNEKNRVLPVFNGGQIALNQKTQRIQGYMMPLEPGEKQRHFLLSSVPLTCSFCVAGGPESMVEVKTKTPIRYSMEPLVVEGRFSVLSDDPFGLYYRMTDASSVQ